MGLGHVLGTRLSKGTFICSVLDLYSDYYSSEEEYYLTNYTYLIDTVRWTKGAGTYCSIKTGLASHD